jgi:TolB-like protein/DNA-binding winged helix-turn-helix (wHTH) protein/Tfp pilus assembly protein PilF
MRLGVLNTDYCLGDWIVRPQRDCIEHGGEVVRLAPKAMAVLQCLACASGGVVSRQELFDTVWPGGEVTDDALAQRIAELRKAFGDSANNARFIETIPKIGFRLIPPVTPLTSKAGSDPKIQGNDSPPGSAARKPFLIASALLVVLALYWHLAGQRSIQEGRLEEDIPSIAVLPFVNMSDDASNEYFSDGISEELLNLLAKVPELRVVSRTSSFSFKDKDITIAEMAEILNVSHLLEGSVRKAGKQVRITAQLIEASSASHLWSETYDRMLDDVFAIQDEISSAVVDALKVKLLNDAPQVSEISPEAYTLYLQAQYLSNQHRQPLFQSAIDLYRQVLEIEPGYAPAWVGIARNYANKVIGGQLSQAEGLQVATEAIKTALQLDPGLAEAHALLGLFHLNFELDFLSAARHFRTAMELSPNDPAVLRKVAKFVAALGKFETAIKLGEDAVLRNPVDAVLWSNLGDYYFYAKRLDKAADVYNKAKNLNPDLATVHFSLGSVLLAANNPEDALAEFLLELHEEYVLKGRTLSLRALNRTEEFDASFKEFRDRFGEQWPSEIAHVYAWTGDHDEAFEWLDKAATMREAGIGASRQELWLTPLQDDPRWQEYLEKIGLSDEQVAAIQFELQ